MAAPDDVGELNALLSEEVRRRLERAQRGERVERRLALADLRPGEVGILEVLVAQVQPVRRYNRKRGGEGSMAKAIVRDATGEAEIVFWDEQTALLADGTFTPGACLRIAGASVKQGRVGLELGVASARITAVPAPATTSLLAGTLLDLAATRITGEPPNVRFQADVTLDCAGQVQRVVVAGDILLRLRSLKPGSAVTLTGVRANPVLDGWWTSDGASLDPPAPTANL